MAKDLPAQEVILGASNVYSAEEQLDQIALYWINLHHGEPQGVTFHLVSAERSVTFDLHGGNRIPRAADRQAKTVADLRAAGIGIRRVLLVHDGTLSSHDVFEWIVTMISREVQLDLVPVTSHDSPPASASDSVHLDQQRAGQLGRDVRLLSERPQTGPEIVRLAREGNYDVLVLPWPGAEWTPSAASSDDWLNHVRQNAPCSIFLAAHPVIPREVVAT